jgi:hypothetical protein
VSDLYDWDINATFSSGWIPAQEAAKVQIGGKDSSAGKIFLTEFQLNHSFASLDGTAL